MLEYRTPINSEQKPILSSAECLEQMGMLARLPATKVANTVEWVNNQAQLPPGLFPVGEATQLPLQLATDGELSLWCCPRHWRSGFLSDQPIIISGKKYPWLQFKGVGATAIHDDSLIITGIRHRSESSHNDTFGLAYADWIDYDRQMTQKAQAAGVKAVPIIALIKLDEVVVEGDQCLPANHPRVKQLLHRRSHPAVEVRAFQTPFRLDDLYNNGFRSNAGCYSVFQQLAPSERIQFLNLALKDVDIWQECHNFQQYFDNLHTLAQVIGWNLKRLGEAGIVHKYLNLHNITLDGSFVDFDGAIRGSPRQCENEVWWVFAKKKLEWFFERMMTLCCAKGRDLGQINGLAHQLMETVRRSYYGVGELDF